MLLVRLRRSALIAVALLAASPPVAGALPDGTRLSEQGSLAQYIEYFGAALPISYGDAQAFDAEGNGVVATVPIGYLHDHPAGGFPANRVVRVVGTPSQYLYDGARLRPINSYYVSTCELYLGGQASPATVPTLWSYTLPIAAPTGCTLPDGTRFTDGGTQEYVSWFGSSLPLSAADRAAYDVEGLRRNAAMAAGYVADHPASRFPSGRVVRPVGTGVSAVYDGVALHPITSPSVLSCALKAAGQTVSATVPVMWSGALPAGSGAECVEPAVSPAPVDAVATPTPTPISEPAPMPRIGVTLAFFFKAAARTTFTSLIVEGAPRGATIRAVCRPKCARSSLLVRSATGRDSLKKLIVKARLRVGTTITVTVAKLGYVGAVKTLRTRKNHRPLVTTSCLPPGAAKGEPCAASH